MIKIKDNKGITLITLIITIVVLLIITGISITLSMDSVDQTLDSQDKSEMLIVQHAIQERYLEYTQTNNSLLLVGEKDGDNYKISDSGKLPLYESREYYLYNNELYYFDGNNKKIVLKGYENAIKNQDVDENKKIINNSDVKIDYFTILGVTGEGVTNSTFIVNYETGYVEKEDSSTSPLSGYNKDIVGDSTSFEVNISN